MLPSILARQLQTGLGDYIETTFPMTNAPFRDSLKSLINAKDAICHEPYYTVRMPFRTYSGENNFFESIHSKYAPYVHQAKAFERLTGNECVSTIIATGTGSGKTECFLYPILEYCYQHRFEKGIKALIIYPMNALASDQAKRIAELIYSSPELKGNVTAGMYVGGHTKNANVVMAADGIITDKDTMLQNPPDILLTNYKMLDYLLVRPKDAQLWKNNSADTLKYIAVDELHTFDGAQGTDLACLLRRLKNRLGTKAGHLCCVGTSATMGSKENVSTILKYASEIFGEPFDEDTSIVTEDRLTYSEFLENISISEFNIPNPDDVAEMKLAIDEDDSDKYINTAVKAWFPSFSEDISSDNGKTALAEILPKHTFFQSIIASINGSFCQSDHIIEELKSSFPELSEISESAAKILIESMISLISWARTGTTGKLRPFLNVHVQLWIKELRRVLGKVSSENITYALENDLNKNQRKHYLPVINCRDCGTTAWVSYLNERSNVTITDLKAFYNNYFDFDKGIIALYPYNSDDIKIKYSGIGKLCPNCLQLKMDENACECDECGETELINVQIPALFASGEKKDDRQYECPFCKSKRGLNLIGLRSATEISASISQMFSSKFNDDKKTLTFSDNVQDAAHRAGFFNSRTWKFGLRCAIQKYISESGNNLSLSDFESGFVDYWHKKMNDEEFISFFTPPNMTWMRAYENMVRSRQVTYDNEFNTLVSRTERRLKYEIMLEYGLSSNIGRTLEKSGCSVLSFDAELIEKTANNVYERLINELAISGLTVQAVRSMIISVLDLMRRKGAFDDEAFYHFTKNGFKNYLLSNKHVSWMPGLRSGRNTPRFVFRNSMINAKLYNLDAVNAKLYQNVVIKHFDTALVNEDVSCIIFDELIKEKLISKLPADNIEVYGINKKKTLITTQITFLKCSHCGTRYTVPENLIEVWENSPCIYDSCCGKMLIDKERHIDYYGKLFSCGDITRINAKEHTGLLDRTDREELERDFKRSRADQKLYDPNVLSCTPTLEMGIDIGDLSSVILCSMPPSQANYAQRVGRAGRKDGNAFTLAVANSKPHDLYFYQDPLDMIAGEVIPPQIFLKASAVLERQFVAYCMDSWVKNGISETAVPRTMKICIDKLESRSIDIFPYNLMEYVKNNLDTMLDSFIDMFDESFADDDNVKQEIIDFAKGNGLSDSPMYIRLLNAFEQVRNERASVQTNVNLLQQMIKDLEAKPKDSSYDEEIKELRLEEAALIGVIKSIENRNVFNFLSDEGLLPNYAFPESGITLKAILKRKDENLTVEDKPKYERMIYEYGRSASAAISEFAPNNSFYVDGKKLVIDQVDIATSKPVKWRLCPNCSHAEEDIAGVHTASCPKCGTPAWADSGQARSMLKVQMVYSNMDYNNSQISDESEDRKSTFFCKQLLVDVDEENDITSAFEMNNDDFPFGFEFVKKAVLREINFGEKDLIGDKITISGIEDVRKGFKICKYCGKLQKDGSKPRHTFTCKVNKDNFDGEAYEDCLFLYREFSTEILRLLIPATTMDSSTVKTESFIAAFMLGMREYFGNVSHLNATISEVPVTNADYRKQYLVIYDSVPGGTGYLKQLLQNENALIEVFEKALSVMENCSCKNDEQKDGCYHCLYAYSQSNSIGNISKNTAIRLLRSILNGKKNIKRISKLGNIATNSMFDSELERKFIEALPYMSTDKRNISVSQTLINGKQGYLLKINDISWEIEPQVDLDVHEGVAVKCRPDFIIRPLFETNKKPVAIFTDGFSFHKDIVSEDTLKRYAIIKSDKYWVWSLSYKDVQDIFQQQGNYYTETLDYNEMIRGKMYQKYIKSKNIEPISLHKMRSLSLLCQYLSLENSEEIFRVHAEAILWSLLNPSMSKNNIEFSVWSKKIEELKSVTAKNTNRYDVGGIWSPRDVNSHLVIYSAIEVIDKKMQNPAVIALLNDKIAERTDKYEAEWNGMWRLSNIMQFMNGFSCLTVNGIENGAYSVICDYVDPDTSSDFVGTSAEWNEVFSLLEYSTDLAKKIAEFSMEHDYDIPEIGYEAIDESERVIGEIEIAWCDKKIAFITEEQNVYRDALIEQGWRIVSDIMMLANEMEGENK